ncbi:MAG: hypothetical protein QOG77_3696 [Solirubrobacteraceae bacterium]|nr:hypothetical protein [Solirubrobacteraceae bacterium]
MYGGEETGTIGARFAGNQVPVFYESENGMQGEGAGVGFRYGGSIRTSSLTSAPTLTGLGTTAAPWLATTSYDLDGTPLKVKQTVRHVNASRSFRVTWAVTNTGTTEATFGLTNAADLYVQGSDSGSTGIDAGPPRFLRGVALDGTRVGITELTPWSHYFGGRWRTATAPLSDADAVYDDTVDPANVDNGVGAQWLNQSVAAGATTSISVGWGFVSAGADPAPTAQPQVTAHPSDPSSGPASFEFHANGDPNIAGFECGLDGGVFDACSTGVTYSGLPDGPHVFRVRGVNADGMYGPAAEIAWTALDTAPPAAPTVSSAPAAHSSDASPTFSFSGEEGSSFACQLDENAWQEDCTSPTTYAELADGLHAFRLRQKNDAGNVGASRTYSWTVDTTAPEPPVLVGAPPARSTAGDARFTFRGAQDATFLCRLDDGAWTPCASPLVLTGLRTGDHVVELVAVDAAGNRSVARRFSWTIAAKPAGTAELSARPLGIPRGGAPGLRDDVTVHRGSVGVACRLSGAAIASCEVRAYEAGPAAGARSAARGRLIGTGSVSYDESGHLLAQVPVRLNALGQRLLRTRAGGLRTSLVVEARPFGGGPALRTRTTATLLPSRRLIVPVAGQFRFLDATLTRATRRYLDALLPSLASSVRIRCEGHTSGPGDAAANLALGQRRADAVCAYLRAHGIRARLVSVSVGQGRPRASNRTPDGQALNRRVELRVTRR